MTGQTELLTDSLELGEALRDEGMRLVTAGAVQADIDRVDEVITGLAATGRPFTANDTRPLLHGVNPPLIGARFAAFAKADVIRLTGRMVKSTLPSTRAHRILEWVGPGPVLTQDGRGA